MSLHESFLTHARFRWLWVALALVGVSISLYVWHDPPVRPNGGSWLGYTLGTIGAVLIFWLTWFGVRKRRYASGTGTLRGWLSAHVYLGMSLIIVATLHSGFQFGWNVHTLAWVLTMLVVLSGLFGVYTYLRYPDRMTRNRNSATLDALMSEIEELDQNALSLADKIDAKIHALVLRSLERERARTARGAWALLKPLRVADETVMQLREWAKEKEHTEPKKDAPTMLMMVDYLSTDRGNIKGQAMRELIDLLSRKKGLLQRVVKDRRYQAMMDVWLYLHVPLTLALLGSLTSHIISVFFYW